MIDHGYQLSYRLAPLRDHDLGALPLYVIQKCKALCFELASVYLRTYVYDHCLMNAETDLPIMSENR